MNRLKATKGLIASEPKLLHLYAEVLCADGQAGKGVRIYWDSTRKPTIGLLRMITEFGSHKLFMGKNGENLCDILITETKL